VIVKFFLLMSKRHTPDAARQRRPGRVSKTIAATSADTGTLFVQKHKELGVSNGSRTSSFGPVIDPTLKSWIDRVLVPALVDKWKEQHKSGDQ
jgi:hypothetical protein